MTFFCASHQTVAHTSPQDGTGAARSRSITNTFPPRQRHPSIFPTLAQLAGVLVALAPFYATAGGLDDYEPAPDPCPPGVVTGVTGEMLAGFMAIREMTCGERPVRAFFDRKTGEQLTDDEILRRIFDGPTPVPVPASWLLLLGGLAMLWRRK